MNRRLDKGAMSGSVESLVLAPWARFSSIEGRGLRIGGCVLLLGAALLLSGCGGPSEEEKEKREAEEAKQQAEAKAAAVAKTCHSQLDSWIASMKELESRLSVGVDYDEYFSAVGDIRVAYDQVPFKALAPECTTAVGVPAENAMNSYRKAAEAWNECFQALSCEEEGISPEVQEHWTRASSLIRQADSGFKVISTP